MESPTPGLSSRRDGPAGRSAAVEKWFGSEAERTESTPRAAGSGGLRREKFPSELGAFDHRRGKAAYIAARKNSRDRDHGDRHQIDPCHPGQFVESHVERAEPGRDGLVDRRQEED